MATNHDRPTRRCSEQTRAERRHGMTSGTRPGGEEGPLWTIARNQAEQGLTKGAECRPSRHRLQRRGVPGDAQEWPQTRHGGFTTMPKCNDNSERVVLGDTGPRAANTWVSTWTGKQLVEPPQALDEPRHHTAKIVCVRRSRCETDALANSDAGKQAQLKTADWVNTNR